MLNHLAETVSRDGAEMRLNITDETEFDLKSWVQKIYDAQEAQGLILTLPEKLLIRHYDDGVWEILDEKHNSIVAGTVNDRGLKR